MSLLEGSIKMVCDSSSWEFFSISLTKHLTLCSPCSIPGDVLVSAPASPSVSEDSSPDEQCGNSEELINKEEKESRKGKGPSTGGDSLFLFH